MGELLDTQSSTAGQLVKGNWKGRERKETWMHKCPQSLRRSCPERRLGSGIAEGSFSLWCLLKSSFSSLHLAWGWGARSDLCRGYLSSSFGSFSPSPSLVRPSRPTLVVPAPIQISEKGDETSREP